MRNLVIRLFGPALFFAALGLVGLAHPDHAQATAADQATATLAATSTPTPYLPDRGPRPSGGKKAVVAAWDQPDPEGHHDYADVLLPRDQQLKNHAAGGGCCVFASCDHAARWFRIKQLIGILNDDLGGGYPQKVDANIQRRYPGYKNYIQCTKRDEGIALMRWALANQRIVCGTYGYGERYGTTIAHMVNPVHWRNGRVAILDNNFPGTLEWMDEDEFIRRWQLNGGTWCYVFLETPPPPIPVNP